MQQYLDLLRAIQDRGTYKPAARANMPGTQSLFGYQFRHDLADGFPLLTTKKMFWKGVVVELLWFLRGDTNIKYLVDNGVNIWNEDAYNYYLKKFKECTSDSVTAMSFADFIDLVKSGVHSNGNSSGWFQRDKYRLGDCGYQYGRVWRGWDGSSYLDRESRIMATPKIDQIYNLIKGLRGNPESRRHIVTAIDPAHDTDLALYWCHAMFQFNCRPMEDEERCNWVRKHFPKLLGTRRDMSLSEWLDDLKAPRYFLDCQLYQRSADVVLGVPFNIASYALLVHLIAKMVGMESGEFIHTFGDVHIYDNHAAAVREQLQREPGTLPTVNVPHIAFDDKFNENIHLAQFEDFELIDYNPQPAIKAELSTGLKK